MVLLMSFFCYGCSGTINNGLSPPHDAKLITVEIKNPVRYTKPFPLEVRYISHDCQKSRLNGFDGSITTEPSYNVVQIPLQQKIGDVWEGKVEMDGGGQCQWKLSAINLGIEYINTTHLGNDLVPGTPVGVTVAFDNDASRNGQFTSIKGDLRITPKYYPYIRERKISEKKKTLSLLGKENFLSYRAFDLKNIYFYPDVDESKVVRFIEPEKKLDGAHSKIIYPDGTIAPPKTLFPNFNLVDKMIVK